MIQNTTDIIKQSWQHKRNTIGEIAKGSDDIKQCISTILSTSKGSIPFMPEFGTDIIQVIGEKSHDALDMAIAIASKEIPKQEPRVEVQSVSGEFNESGQITIKIHYTEKISQNEDYTEVYL